MLKSRKFWLVWNQAGGVPTYQHETKERAQREAERLTRRHGGAFHVLELVGTVERDDVKWSEPQSGEGRAEAGRSHSDMRADDSDQGYAHVVADDDECSCTTRQVCRHCYNK